MSIKISPSHAEGGCQLFKAPADPTPAAALFADRFLLIDSKFSRTVIRTQPSILLYVVISFLLCFSVGCAAVYYSGEVEEDAQRHAVYVGPSADLENSIRAEFDSLSSGTRQLASYVKFNPNCSTLDAQAEDYMREIMHWDDRISSLGILPSFVSKYRFPEVDGATVMDLLAAYNSVAKEIIQREGVWFTLPESQPGRGLPGSLATYAIWLPAPSYDFDLGCGLQPTNCADVCYNEKTGMKYYGSVRAQVDMSSWFSGSHVVLQNVRNQDLLLRIIAKEPKDAKASHDHDMHPHEAVVYETGRLPKKSPVSRAFQVSNLVWEIELEPAAGWEPEWIDRLYFAVFGVSVCLSVFTAWLLIAKYRHDQLLASMLPRSVIQHLVSKKQSFAEQFDNVTIFFSDIVGFTELSAGLEPIKVVELLDGLYNIFDQLAQKHGIYKVETIGDAYMAVAGCQTQEVEPARAALAMARFASDVVAAIEVFRPACLGERRLQIRVGLHSGPVVGGVVGSKMPRYCLFGDTVNTASRMETTSEPMRVQASHTTTRLLCGDAMNGVNGVGELLSVVGKDNSEDTGLALESRGGVSIKGKGVMHTYWLHNTLLAQGESQQSLNGTKTSRELNYRPTVPYSVSQDDSTAVRKWSEEECECDLFPNVI